MKLKSKFLIAAAIILAVYIPAVHAQANLTFSGGNGTPLTITLQQSVSYTITNTNCNPGGGPVFIFDETGSPFAGFPSVTGTMTYSINGGAANEINLASSGFTRNDRSSNDIGLSGSVPGASNGFTVVLNAGSVTTTGDVAGPPPANGSYATFIGNGVDIRCSANGEAVSPTSAFVSISGRVLISRGRGLAGASVYFTDSEGNLRTTRTNSLGYYRFEDVPVGQTVVVTVASKRLRFTPQVINLSEEVTQLDFFADK